MIRIVWQEESAATAQANAAASSGLSSVLNALPGFDPNDPRLQVRQCDPTCLFFFNNLNSKLC